jgi:hypothetical protein
MLAIYSVTGRVVRMVYTDTGDIAIRLPDGSRQIVSSARLRPL